MLSLAFLLKIIPSCLTKLVVTSYEFDKLMVQVTKELGYISDKRYEAQMYFACILALNHYLYNQSYEFMSINVKVNEEVVEKSKKKKTNKKASKMNFYIIRNTKDEIRKLREEITKETILMNYRSESTLKETNSSQTSTPTTTTTTTTISTKTELTKEDYKAYIEKINQLLSTTLKFSIPNGHKKLWHSKLTATQLLSIIIQKITEMESGETELECYLRQNNPFGEESTTNVLYQVLRAIEVEIECGRKKQILMTEERTKELKRLVENIIKIIKNSNCSEIVGLGFSHELNTIQSPPYNLNKTAENILNYQLKMN